jgi:hypothetical protein
LAGEDEQTDFFRIDRTGCVAEKKTAGNQREELAM